MKKIILIRLALLCLILVGTVSCGTIRPVGMQGGMPPPQMMVGGQPQFHPGHQQMHVNHQGGQQMNVQHHDGGGRGQTTDRGGILQKWDIVDGRPVKAGSATWLDQHPGSTHNGLNVRTNERIVMSDDQFNTFRADFNNPNASDPGYRRDTAPRQSSPSSQISEENINRGDIDIVPYQ